MATLFYNGVKLDFIRTVNLQFFPRFDPTGLDKECTEVVLEVEGYWSEYGLGADKQGYGLSVDGYGGTPVTQAGGWGVRGSRVGASLNNLKDVLGAPRRTLQYFVGPDLVFEAPQRLADGTRMPCDVRGGPFPELLNAPQIVGDKTALVRFRVRCFVSQCQHWLLSNRWTLQDHVDANHYTTVTTRGRAVFRQDFVRQYGFFADDFRHLLLLSITPGHQRSSVHVTQDASGSVIDYVVVDRQTNYGTGANSLITRVDCHAVAGNDYPIKSIEDRLAKNAKAAGGILQAGLNLATGNIGDAVVDAATAAGTIISSNLAKSFVSGVARVYGSPTLQPGVHRHYLARVAQSIVNDRCNAWVRGGAWLPGVTRPIPVSSRVSVDWSSHAPPYAEYRADFMVGLFDWLQTFVGNNELGLLNWKDVIEGGPMPLNFGALTERSKLPNANNTRGTALARMVAQVLSQNTCESPSHTPEVYSLSSERPVPYSVSTGRTERSLQASGLGG